MPINFPIPLLPSSLSFSPITRIGKRSRRPKEACIISEEGRRGGEEAGKVCESRVGERGHKRFIRMLSASVCLNNLWLLHFLSLLWQHSSSEFPKCLPRGKIEGKDLISPLCLRFPPFSLETKRHPSCV